MKKAVEVRDGKTSTLNVIKVDESAEPEEKVSKHENSGTLVTVKVPESADAERGKGQEKEGKCKFLE